MSEKRPIRQKLVLCGSTQPGVRPPSHPHLCNISDQIIKGKGAFSAFELPSSILLIGLRSITVLDQHLFVMDTLLQHVTPRDHLCLKNLCLPLVAVIQPFCGCFWPLCPPPLPHFPPFLSLTHSLQAFLKIQCSPLCGLVLHSWNNTAGLI